MAQQSYQAITLTANIVLTWPFSFTGTYPIADIMDISPSGNGFTITLPDATLTQPGQTIEINNVSSYSFSILLNDGVTNLVTVDSGDVLKIYLTNTPSTPASNGAWRVIPSGGGTNAITAFVLESSDGSITIENGAQTPPGEVTDFILPASLSNILTNITEEGFVVITGTNPLTWATRTLTSDTNFIITNEDGVDGDPIISLNNAIGPIDSLAVGDLGISGEVITNNITNGNVQINSNGTGQIQINGVATDTSQNVSEINNLTINGLFYSPYMPKAFVTFTDTLLDEGNTIVVQNQANISEIIGSNGQYVIAFTTEMDSINYGIIFGLGSNGTDLPFVSNVYYVVRETTSVTIQITDASGELVTAVPYGVTIAIMSE